MYNLKMSGKLDKLSGLLVGGMTEMNDNHVPFGSTAIEIISDHVSAYDYPVCFDFPLGHLNNNHSVIFGNKHELEVSTKAATLTNISI
jgi:muramoyltetrapeptide carboxypeptidase